MLHGLAGVILRDRTIVMMVVGPTFPVEHCMRNSFRVAEGPGLTAHGEDLPEGSHHEKQKHKLAVHETILVRALSQACGRNT
jgi:hypothetical protein